MPIFDALVDAPEQKIILVRHEQGATHMADGYAKVTGKTGVVLVTSGPGATNTVTGILTAQMDSVPLVILTGQTITPNLGKDAFQEADVFGVTMPIVKHSYLVRDVKDLSRVVNEAFHLASTGRPGPVLVDLPKDVVSNEWDEDFLQALTFPDIKFRQEAAQMESNMLQNCSQNQNSHCFMWVPVLLFQEPAGRYKNLLKSYRHLLLQLCWAKVLFPKCIHFL